MILPVVKLGILALKTICKPIANRLKKEASLHTKFRQFIINIAQVVGAAVFFEVQRSSRSEARKEELCRQELQAMKQRDQDLAKEVELLRHKIEELEQLAKGRGLTGIFHFRHAHTNEDGKLKNT
ncbi:hypothetical protein I3760_03G175600 [Carya illinoinensis]|nr:hypothetical protein I3760_03G175600 [Carya illinoinensis]